LKRREKRCRLLRELGRELLALNAQSTAEMDAAFATIVQSRASALLIGADILFNTRRRQLAAHAARHGVAAISGIREFVLAGGLMSYGASDTNAYRRAGSHYVAPILRGAKPGDLPVEMPTKYELVISVVAAKALGLDHSRQAARHRRRGDRVKRRTFIGLLLRARGWTSRSFRFL
jgi:putative ABC transport system substrate-binding protein